MLLRFSRERSHISKRNFTEKRKISIMEPGNLSKGLKSNQPTKKIVSKLGQELRKNSCKLTLIERKGCFLCSSWRILTLTNSNSSSFSYRQTRTLHVALERGTPWTLIGLAIKALAVGFTKGRLSVHARY